MHKQNRLALYFFVICELFTSTSTTRAQDHELLIAPSPEYNLYIEYCSTKNPSSCERIYNRKAVNHLEKKGFHIVDDHTTSETIVIQLHDGCTYFEICEPQLYGREAIIRLQDTRTFQIHYERSLKKMIYPITSKALLKDIIELFDPFGSNP